MHRTTIDLEVEAFERAREALGTNGFGNTVNAALRRVGREDALARAAQRLREGRFCAPTLEELAELRQPRV
jgi:Arc/MetJ family transcription regulator